KCIKVARHSGMPLSFVIRYYSYNPEKNLSRAEADFLALTGIRCVTVWEAAKMSATGYDNGVKHARSASRQAIKCGQPTGTPIYFAIDYGATEAQKAGIKRYYEGVRDGLATAA